MNDDVEAEADRLRPRRQPARGDVGSFSISCTVDLTSLLGRACESLRLPATGKGLQLTSQVQLGLAVRGDEDALVRLFVTVVDDAIKFLNDGGPAAALAAGPPSWRESRLTQGRRRVALRPGELVDAVLVGVVLVGVVLIDADRRVRAVGVEGGDDLELVTDLDTGHVDSDRGSGC